MDEERLKEIEARVEAATPGRLFVWDNEEGWRVDPREGAWDENEQGPLDGALIYGWHREDLELFVEARQDIPNLTAALRAAQARVAELEAVVGVVEDHAVDLEVINWALVAIGSSLGPPVIQDIRDALDKAKKQDQEKVPDTYEEDLPIEPEPKT